MTEKIFHSKGLSMVKGTNSYSIKGRLMCALTFLIALVIPTLGFSLGSGGLLVEVPYAEVTVDGAQRSDWVVYVHPIEGSWLLIPPGDTAYAMDKAKKHSVSIKKADLLSTAWPKVIDGPEHIPSVIQKMRPSFGKNNAKTVLDDGRVINIYIER